jgi:S-DNA-T family DNA segregation ATPase FtsK/SpoIIIE
VAAGIEDAVSKVNAAWPGRRAQPVRLLPTKIDRSDLPPGTDRQIVLGVQEDNLAPVHFDLEGEQHFIAFMDGESGKTNLLRTMIRGIEDSYTSKEAVIILVDYRRTMLGYVDKDYLIGYAVSANQLDGMITDVVSSMRKRLPGPDVTPEQLRDRSWWTGPELFVIVDDYDLVATSGTNPLQPLAEFLPQAKDVGLHLFTARRTGGASRALYDPVIGRLKELASPGLVGNGQRDEGSLLGTARPAALPPGRGILVTRRAGQQLIQVAWTTPKDL